MIIAALLAWLVPALKNVLTRPREHVRRLIQGLRGLGREAWGVGKVLVPGAALGLVYSTFEAELETHLLTALAGGIVIVLAVKPLRSRAFRYLGQARRTRASRNRRARRRASLKPCNASPRCPSNYTFRSTS